MRRLGAVLLGGLLAAVPISGWAHAAHAPVAGQPAVWRTYDLVVDLDHLPRTYTCDQLWYVFHGILLRLGVPIDTLNVLPYHCSRSPSGDLRSPHVQVSFRMPEVLHGKAVKWAELSADRRLIAIGPGEPKRLKPTDCRLLRQIRETLLESLPVKVAHSDLLCGQHRPFGLTVQVWVAAGHG